MEDGKLEIVTCKREMEEKDKIISELKTELQEDNSDSMKILRRGEKSVKTTKIS